MHQERKVNSRSIQAVVISKSRDMALVQDYLRPEPAADEVVVRLRAAALNRRDYWITQGMYPGLQLPTVPGSDGAGVVIEAGGESGQCWLGTEVVINPAALDAWKTAPATVIVPSATAPPISTSRPTSGSRRRPDVTRAQETSILGQTLRK